jgi:hypothetical protein
MRRAMRGDSSQIQSSCSANSTAARNSTCVNVCATSMFHSECFKAGLCGRGLARRRPPTNMAAIHVQSPATSAVAQIAASTDSRCARMECSVQHTR